MTKTVLHSYPWYISDWRNSETRIDFSMAERGLYRELLDHCYAEGSLPVEESKLAKIAGCSDREFRKLWPAVKSQFVLDCNRLWHARVSELRPKLEAWHEQKRMAGKSGGIAKAVANARANATTPAKRSPEQPSSGRSSHPHPHPLPHPLPEEPPAPSPDPPAAAVLEIVPAKPDPVLTTLDECERLYAMAGKPIPERHRNLAVQLLIGIQHDKLPRLPNYIKWALASGTWSDAAHTKGFLKLLHDGDWDVDLTMRTLPTAAQNRTKTDIAQDEATRNFLRKRGAL